MGDNTEVTALAPGDDLVVRIEKVVADGQCLARIDGLVVFVTGGLPDELARVRVTGVGKRGAFFRSRVVEILEPSPHRVVEPCPVATVCGGCDWQHSTLAYQRVLKAEVLADCLVRIAGVDHIRETSVHDLIVEELSDESGTNWRTRMRYAVTDNGEIGLRAARSHNVIPAQECLLPVTAITNRVGDAEAAGSALVAVAPSAGDVAFVRADDHYPVRERVKHREFEVDVNGFWQVHRGAPTVLVDAVFQWVTAEPGTCVLDLYSGVGLFAAFLAPLVGPLGTIHAVEGDRRAVHHARANTRDLPQVHHHHAAVDEWLTTYVGPADVVVLDPPRAGTGRGVIDELSRLNPRVIVYVSCDAATFARDVRRLGDVGYELAELRSFDLFPMTKHFEVVARFARPIDRAVLRSNS